MTRSRVLALLSFAAFALFFGIILWFVPRIDLSVAIAIGLVLAGYDLWTQLGPSKNH